MAKQKYSSEVRFGNVDGGIHNTIVGGRDVRNATITIHGRPISPDRELTVDELRLLLGDIQEDLAKIVAQQEALSEISPDAPSTIQGAEQNIMAAAESIAETPDVEPEQAKTAEQTLEKAAKLLALILDDAKAVIEKAAEVGKAVKPIAAQLEPLIEKVGVAALWVAKLWLTGP